MKKKILLITTFVFSFLFIENVYAGPTCVYENNVARFTCNVNDTSVSCSISALNKDARLKWNQDSSQLVIKNFQDTTTKTWKCRDEIYTKYNINSGGVTEYSSLVASGGGSGYVTFKKNASLSKGEGDSYGDDLLNCSYKQTNGNGVVTLTIDKNSKKLSFTSNCVKNYTYNDYESATKDSKGCPNNVYITADQGGCSINNSPSPIGGSDTKTTNKVIPDANNNTTDNNTDSGGGESEYGSCPLGVNTTKDIAGIWKIIRIVAPLLCIALSILDAVLALTKGEAAGELKKVAMKFFRRVMYVILLLFLNVLLNAILNFALGIDKGCDLGEDLSPSAPTTNNSSSTVACSSLGIQDCNARSDCELYQNGSSPACRAK